MISMGYLCRTSAGRQPVGMNQILNLSQKLRVLQGSWHIRQKCWKLMIRGFQVCTALSTTYCGGTCSSASWKVPNIVPQRQKICPSVLSMYCGMIAWCTLCWEGVTITYSNHPILPICLV